MQNRLADDHDELNPLLLAITDNNVALLKELIEAHPVALDALADPLILHTANDLANEAVVTTLVDAGVNLLGLNSAGQRTDEVVNSIMFHKKQTLKEAIERGELTTVAAFIDNNLDWLKIGLNVQDNVQEQALHFAARLGQLCSLQYLIEAQAKYYETSEVRVINDCLNQRGDNILHISAAFGHTEMLTYLLAQRANVNRLGLRNYTALHYACQNYREAVIDVLLRNGADAMRLAQLQNDWWDTREWQPFQMGGGVQYAYRHTSKLCTIITQGDVNDENKRFQVREFFEFNPYWLQTSISLFHGSALLCAVAYSNLILIDEIATLLARHTDQTIATVLNTVCNSWYQNSLMLASSLPVARKLIEMGADVNYVPDTPNNVMPPSRIIESTHYAGSEELTILLINSGAHLGKLTRPYVYSFVELPAVTKVISNIIAAIKADDFTELTSIIAKNHTWLQAPLDKNHSTALDIAARHDKKAMVRFIINQVRLHGAYEDLSNLLNKIDGLGLSTLHYIAFHQAHSSAEVSEDLFAYALECARLDDTAPAINPDHQVVFAELGQGDIDFMARLLKVLPQAICYLDQLAVRNKINLISTVKTLVYIVPEAFDILIRDTRIRQMMSKHKNNFCEILSLLPNQQLARNYPIIHDTLREHTNFLGIKGTLSVTQFASRFVKRSNFKDKTASQLFKGNINHHGLFNTPIDLHKANYHYHKVLTGSHLSNKIHALFELAHLYLNFDRGKSLAYLDQIMQLTVDVKNELAQDIIDIKSDALHLKSMMLQPPRPSSGF